MNYSDFKSTILTQIQHRVGYEKKVQIQEIIKNNHVPLDGLSILEAGNNISPTIYLNSYFLSFKNGTSIPTICDEILLLYEKNRSPSPIDLEFFTNFSKIKDKIVFKLVNLEKNKILLKEIPHIPYLDLAIIFYCLVDAGERGNITILIRNQHLKLWNITDKELYDLAAINTPFLLPDDFNSMTSILESYLETQSISNELPGSTYALCPMYVLTNSSKLFGAACILYNGMLKKIAETLQSCFYILPSSVHEGATRFAL
ncbi:MAG: DUF5688 family protein [Lachnospiraceae bacterium]